MQVGVQRRRHVAAAAAGGGAAARRRAARAALLAGALLPQLQEEAHAAAVLAAPLLPLGRRRRSARLRRLLLVLQAQRRRRRRRARRASTHPYAGDRALQAQAAAQQLRAHALGLQRRQQLRDQRRTAAALGLCGRLAAGQAPRQQALPLRAHGRRQLGWAGGALLG